MDGILQENYMYFLEFKVMIKPHKTFRIMCKTMRLMWNAKRGFDGDQLANTFFNFL